MITTYGVFGKIEYVIGLKIGQTATTVTFEGGSINNRGVTPARYTTNSPVLQRAIESSHEYRIGIIKKISSTPEHSDMVGARKIAAAKAAAERKSKEEAEKAAAAAAEDVVQEPAPEAQATVAEAQASVEEPATEPQGTDADADETGEDKATGDDALGDDTAENGMLTVSVTCIEDAVEYLKKNHGYKSADLRSKVSVERAATQHGIVFVGL